MNHYKKPRSYDIDIEVSYMPFRSEERRRQAYYVQATLFLKAKERNLRGDYYNMQKEQKLQQQYQHKKGRLESVLGSYC